MFNLLCVAELLAAAQTLAGLSKPAKRDYRSVRNYIDDESPLLGEEADYILCKEDLITIKPGRENAWLDAFVEKMLQKICCPPIRVSGPITSMAFRVMLKPCSTCFVLQ